MDRPALSIKVDNAPPARPQTGLQAADIVTEALVEGGLTRFFATFQSQDAPTVGPIRSGRPVDADLLSELGGGIFAFAGGVAGELAPIKARSGAVLLDAGAFPQCFWRARDRGAPYNLYTSTTALYRTGTKKGAAPAPALFRYSPTTPVGAAAGTVTLRFSTMSTVTWRFDPGASRYDRVQDGVPAKDSGGADLTADDVVILSVAIGHTGITDQAGNEDPLVIVTGAGPAWVLRDGVLQGGRWSRPTSQDRVSLTANDGTPMMLRPGRTWMELLPAPGSPAIG